MTWALTCGARAILLAHAFQHPGRALSWNQVLELLGPQTPGLGWRSADLARALDGLGVRAQHLKIQPWDTGLVLSVTQYLEGPGAAILKYESRGSGHFEFVPEPRTWVWARLTEPSQVTRRAWLISGPS